MRCGPTGCTTPHSVLHLHAAAHAQLHDALALLDALARLRIAQAVPPAQAHAVGHGSPKLCCCCCIMHGMGHATVGHALPRAGNTGSTGAHEQQQRWKQRNQCTAAATRVVLPLCAYMHACIHACVASPATRAPWMGGWGVHAFLRMEGWRACTRRAHVVELLVLPYSRSAAKDVIMARVGRPSAPCSPLSTA